MCKYVDEINYLNAMSLVFIHTDLVDPWVLSSLVDDMTKEIQSLETGEDQDQHDWKRKLVTEKHDRSVRV